VSRAAEEVTVHLPVDPPVLDGPAWQAFLTVLVQDAEAQHGPGWRHRLREMEGGVVTEVPPTVDRAGRR
jgi:hypothetical protein